jgi:uncharacterized protein (TIGR02284 family)
MTASNEHDIKVLNDLIETTLDSAEGYGEAAKDATNPGFKSLFERRARQRKQITAEFQATVRTLGGKPEDDGTVLAAAHRVFVNFKSAVTGSDQSVVNEVERGEDHIKAKFEAALMDNDVSASTKNTIQAAYASVKADHDQMRDLKHSMKQAS